jgi:PAS domain S-box-containing protein
MNDQDKTKEQLILELRSLRRELAALRKNQVSQSSKGFLSQVINHIRTPIFVKDANHRWVFLNDAACEMMGHSRDSLLGKTDHDLFPEEQAQTFWAKDDLVLTTDEININEEAINWHNRVRTVVTIKDRFVHPKTQEKYIVGIIQDITERKQLEEKLKGTLNFLQTLMDTIPAPIFFKDKNGLYLGCNRAFENSLGVTREELIGKSVFDIAPLELAVKYQEMDTALFDEPGVQVYEESVRYADGVYHDVFFSKSTLRDSDGAPAGIVGVMLDVTERKHAEERFSQMVELSPFPISIINSNGKYLYLNKRFTDLLGYTVDDIPNGRTWFRKAFPDLELRQKAISCWITDLKDNRGFEARVREFRVQCKDGTFRDLLFRPACIHGGMQFITYQDLTELKQAQQTLRESEQRYRSIFDHSPLGLMHFDANANIVDCNRKYVEIMGSSKEALIGFPMLDRLRDHAMRSALLKALSGEHGFFEGDYLSVTGGKLAAIRAWFNRITTDDGELLGGVCIAEDISAGREADRKLRESQARYRAIVEDQTELISRFSPDGTLNFVNDAYCRYFGETLDELIGRNFWHHVPPEDQEELRETFASLSRERPVASIEHKVITRNGEVRWQQWTDRAILGEKGEVIEIQAVGRDITTQKRAEKELKESEDRLRILFECAPDAYFLYDLEGNFIDGNKAAEEISEYKRQELIGKNFLDLNLISAEQVEYAAKLLAINALACPTGPSEFILNRKNSGEVHLEVRTFPTVIGGRTLVLGIARDITARKKAEGALRESERQLRWLSGRLLRAQEDERKRIAAELHDSIASSLGGIKFGLESVLIEIESEPVAQNLKQLVTVTQDTIAEARRLITDLRPAMLDHLGLIPTIGWFCKRFSSLYPGIHLERSIAVQEEELPERIKIIVFRVMQEAFHNAAKYSYAKRLKLSLKRSRTVIQLLIADNGVGFDLRNALANVSPEKGLGLTSMRERVELSGGQFAIESATGEGTTISVSWRCTTGA